MIRLYSLGRFELRAGGHTTGDVVPTQPKRLALATYLALATPRGLQRRDALLALFWPESSQDEARNALRQALHHLRQQLGDDALQTVGDDQVALVQGRVWCDAIELEECATAGDDARAVELYEGPFLDAVFIRGVSTEFEEWIDRTRTRLRTTASESARRLAEREQREGRVTAAIAAARRRCEIDPENEAAVRAFLTLLDDNGQRADAVTEGERFRQLLQQRYEIEPSPETESLIESIRSGARVPTLVQRTDPKRSPVAIPSPVATRSPVPQDGASDAALIAQPRPRRSWAIARTIGIAAIAVLALIVWRGRTATTAALPPAPPDRIFVTDFTDVTPGTRLGALVANALRVDLAQSARLHVLTTAQVRAAVRLLDRPVEVAIDDSLARAIAIREGVKGFVTGDVHAVGSTIVLAARLVAAPNGDELAAAREVARDSADVIPAIERLSRALRHRIGESLVQVNATLPLSRVTTSSLAALGKYTEGLQRIDAGDRAGGVAMLEQAVAIDSGFATAYRMLGSTYGVLGEPARATAALGRAFENRGRLTTKERYLVMGSYYRNVTQEYGRAVEAYRALLALYPDDIAANNNLALTLTSLGQHAAAETLLRRVILADSSQVNARLVLAEGFAARGRFSDAWEVIGDASKRFPDHPVVALTRIYIAAAESDWLRALAYAGERLQLVTASVQRIDALQTLGQIELLTGRLRSARDHLEESMRLARSSGSPRKYLWSAIVLGWLDLRYRLRPDDARAQLKRALATYPLARLAPDDVPDVELASLYAALGLTNDARALLQDSSVAPGSGEPQLLGIVRGAEGRWGDAVVALREASTANSECPICALPQLAEAEEQVGNVDAAIAAAEKYVRTPFIQRFEPDAAHLSETLLRLGALYEQKNDAARATQAYQRLLDTWSGADAELAPQVERLRARVAATRSRGASSTAGAPTS